jgi:hypothetical protein
MRVFSTACDSASITSTVSKWRPFSFIFNRGNREKQGGWGTTVMSLLVKYSVVRKEVWDGELSWRNSFFVAKVPSEVFAHCRVVTVKRHNNMRDWLFGLPGRILCEQSL